MKRHSLLGRKAMTNPDGILKSRYYFADKGLYSQNCWMWDMDHKEGWVPKNWRFQTVILEKTLEIPLDSKEVKPVNPKGSQSWIFTGRTDAKAEAPILWPPDAKSWLIGKDPDAGKDWRQEEKRVTRWLDGIIDSGHEFEQTSGGKLGVLQSMGLQRVGHDLVTEQQFSRVLKPWVTLEDSIRVGSNSW